jgi:hypothetical protein
VGRSRADERLSATLSLTTKRKSARDRRIGRVKYERGGIGGEKEGDKGAPARPSSNVFEAGRRRFTLAEMTSAREGLREGRRPWAAPSLIPC